MVDREIREKLIETFRIYFPEVFTRNKTTISQKKCILPKIQTYCRIASFLNNKFGKRLDSDKELFDEIVNQMEVRRCTENTLATKVEAESLGRRKVPFREVLSHDIIDFPEMTQKELKIFFAGSYQLNQAISYLAEMMVKR